MPHMFRNLAGEDQMSWDFDTCVRRKEQCNAYEIVIRKQLDEVRVL